MVVKNSILTTTTPPSKRQSRALAADAHITGSGSYNRGPEQFIELLGPFAVRAVPRRLG
ncbi:hypothetical protein ACFPRL_25870 [Pseudoclavibacter helvolus]